MPRSAFFKRYPTEPSARQPIHTVYGGAHRFRANTARRLGELALEAMTVHAADALAFGRALGLITRPLPAGLESAQAIASRMASDAPSLRREHPALWLAHSVSLRVRDKLQREPVEDFRIDFEDGLGRVGDDDEDALAQQVARELTAGMLEETLPPFVGLRIKALNTPDNARRAVRTLDLVTSALIAQAGRLPQGFVVTVPKLATPEQVHALVAILDRLERGLQLEPGTLRFEMMVEVPQALIDHKGRVALPRMLRYAEGRCIGAHLGAYDLVASCGVTLDANLEHPYAALAREIMMLTFTGTGVRLADGAVTTLPVGDGDEAVHQGWRAHADQVRRALSEGIHQGWDLHPSQLPSRYGAVYAYYLERLERATARMRSFLRAEGRAHVSSNLIEDEATARGVLNFFQRGLACGALTEDEILAAGLHPDQLHATSFAPIIAT